ncbi:hypothetical protein BDB01DRAFT_793166 [Pilobolus umbonatus]|nr:hypothetical protein BDB01DRAFT_793166 [Pilobolus umbonatus]
MGQGESHLKPTVILAYVANSYCQSIISISHPSDTDNILTHPELYGLRHCPSTPLDSSLTYQPQSEDTHSLERDLSYVDRVYYPTNTPAITIKNKHYKDNGRPFTYDHLTAAGYKPIEDIHLANQRICRLSSNISMLTMVRTLDLTGNHLYELPESIGYMQQLEVLLISNNNISILPGAIGYLSNLSELDASKNYLTTITPYICYLKKLKSLSFARNSIKRLPTEISELTNLISLDLSGNPVRVLPAEVSQLPYLRKIHLEHCPLNISTMTYTLNHNAPSLVESCARSILLNKVEYKHTLPGHLQNYMGKAKKCTSCRSPYFESYVVRGRLAEKGDIKIPFEYRLCSAHWSDVEDRMLSMFSTGSQPISPTIVPMPHLPDLPLSAAVDNKPSISKKTHHASIVGVNDSTLTDRSVSNPVPEMVENKGNKHDRKSKSSFKRWTTKLRSSLS